MRNTLTAERLREVVSYNQDTGVFIRLVNSKKGKAKAGDIAGHIEATGYRAIWILGNKYLAHRLAWLYITGEWPKDQVDKSRLHMEAA